LNREILIMQGSSAKPLLLFLITFALVFYGLGASFVEGFVNYKTWHLIGPNEFQAYHQSLSRRIIPVMVIPIFLSVLLTILLIWIRPSAIPRWMLIVSAVLGLTGIISSVAIQIPIQTTLSNQGLNHELLEELIKTDWLRKITLTVRAGLFLWMMAKVLQIDASWSIERGKDKPVV
jgi:hypothetical protein